MREIEFTYANQRSVDEERPMTEVDGNRRGDGTVYNHKRDCGCSACRGQRKAAGHAPTEGERCFG